MFQLALQLFCFAPQHFLLPALLKALLRVVLLVGQIFLALGQRIEFFKRVLHLFLMLLSWRNGLCRLVLIFFCIQFQVEETRQVAARIAASSSSASLLSKGNLDFPETRLGSEQSLKRFLLQWNRILPLHTLQLFGRRRHGRGGILHVLIEIGEFLVGLGDITTLHADRERRDLIAELLLRVREELSGCRRVFGSGGVVILLLPGSGDQFLFALRNFRLVVRFPASAGTAAVLLRLRKFALKGFDLNERNVGARFTVAIPSSSVEAYQITGHQLIVLQRKHIGALSAFCTGRFEQIHIAVRPAIHGIVEVNFMQAELVSGLRVHGVFLDGAGPVVASRTGDRDLRRRSLVYCDEVVFREPHLLSFARLRQMVRTVLLQMDRALVRIARAARKRNDLAVVQRE